MKDFGSARKHFEKALKRIRTAQYAQEAKEALQKLKKIGIWLDSIASSGKTLSWIIAGRKLRFAHSLPKEAGVTKSRHD